MCVARRARRIGSHGVNGDASPTERLFFALWPDAGLRECCARLTRDLDVGGGKCVPGVNLHITVCFLGSVDRATRGCVENAMDTVRAAPTTLTLDRLGYFPKPRVLWVGASIVPEPIKTLAHVVDRLARNCGVRTDTRPFVPHMTLCRNVRRPPPMSAIEPLSWPVTMLALVKSDTRESGAIYTVLRTWPLHAA